MIDDDARLSEMVASYLSARGLEVGTRADGATGLRALLEESFDVVVLDVMLPKRDGFDVLRTMRERGDATPVLILSARGSDRDRIRGLELGADDYLGKPFNLRELMLRVAALLRRAPVVPPTADTVDVAGRRVDFRAHRVLLPDGEAHELSDSELRLLRILTSRPNEVLTRRELLDHVFGAGATPSPRTLDNLVLALRRVLEPVPGRPRHLHTVRGVGLRFDP